MPRSRRVHSQSQGPQSGPQERGSQAPAVSNQRRQDQLPGVGQGDGPGPSAFGQAAAAGGTSAAWQEVVSGNRVLRRGAKGAAVEDLQEYLLDQGQQLDVDGDFGPGTERAVKAVQASLGLTVSGIVDGTTARALSGQSPAPARGDQNDAHQQDTPTTDTNAATTIDEINVSANSFERQGLRAGVFSKALTAFETAWKNGDTEKLIFTVIDYELHSSEKRLWVIDLATGDLLHHEHTTHGSGSDRNHDGLADRVSNVDGSNSSNVGLLRTAETYTGRHGHSLRLDGLEQGFNDNARSRAIVIHPAAYADDSFRDRHGKMGRSQGCPALDPDVSGEIIDTIKGGSLIFAYYPDPAWLERSNYLN